MLRALVVLLLLANLAFYVWTLGWLDGAVGVRAAGDREPERLLRQVRPESVRLLPPRAGAAVASVTPATVCLEAGPFDDAELDAAQAAVQAALPAGAVATVRGVEPRPAWLVYLGRYATREALTKRTEELERRKLPYEEVGDDPALAPGLALGRFADRAAATQALDRFARQGLRGARVVEQLAAPPQSRHMLRIEQADAQQAQRLLALSSDALRNGFAACATTPGRP